MAAVKDLGNVKVSALQNMQTQGNAEGSFMGGFFFGAPIPGPITAKKAMTKLIRVGTTGSPDPLVDPAKQFLNNSPDPNLYDPFENPKRSGRTESPSLDDINFGMPEVGIPMMGGSTYSPQGGSVDSAVTIPGLLDVLNKIERNTATSGVGA